MKVDRPDQCQDRREDGTAVNLHEKRHPREGRRPPEGPPGTRRGGSVQKPRKIAAAARDRPASRPSSRAPWASRFGFEREEGGEAAAIARGPERRRAQVADQDPQGRRARPRPLRRGSAGRSSGLMPDRVVHPVSDTAEAGRGPGRSGASWIFQNVGGVNPCGLISTVIPGPPPPSEATPEMRDLVVRRRRVAGLVDDQRQGRCRAEAARRPRGTRPASRSASVGGDRVGAQSCRSWSGSGRSKGSTPIRAGERPFRS